jgi:DNA polymerase III epsilon subunit family exonuclease
MPRWLDCTLVGFDTETTGLSFQDDRIFEVGLVTFEGGEQVESWCPMVDPVKALSRESLEKTGVTDEDLKGKPVFATIAPELVERMSGKVVVGYNILGFDLPMLEAELKRNGLAMPGFAALDVLVFARGLVKSGRHTLSDMVRQFGITMETAHRATADAEATVRLLLAMAPQLPADLDDLVRLQGQWREEQRSARAMWRKKDDAPPSPESFLRQETASSSLKVDADGRVSLGPSYVYGRETDPLRAFLIAYTATPPRTATNNENPGLG